MTKPIDELALKHPLVLEQAHNLSMRTNSPVSVRLTSSGADLFVGIFPESDTRPFFIVNG
jgi:hypothetical protein